MVKFQTPQFEPANWLPNGHFQTVFASLVMPVPFPNYRREVIELPDGDITAADWVDGEDDKPLLVLIHGMEGSSTSRYARLLMSECEARGWRGVVLHMRSCGGLVNRHKTFYHAGFYQDIQYFIEEFLPARNIAGPCFLAGVSLGGSQVAHYLAKGSPKGHVNASVMISTPLDLGASADFLNTWLSQQYVIRFRRTLLAKYKKKAVLLKGHVMLEDLARARTFWDLDNSATAPIHGFKDAVHYYREMSAKNCLQDIQVPTLYLASRDDPFVPEDSMPDRQVQNGNFTSLLTRHGGHVGFVDHYGQSWMTPTVFKYFSSFEV